MNLQKYFLLDLKKLGIVILAFIIAVILHNVISGLLKVEEPIFFILAVIAIPGYFIIMVSYTIIYNFRKTKK